MRNAMKSMLGAAFVCVLSGVPVCGAYVISPLSDGASSATVYPGVQFDIDIVLTSDAQDEHNSAIFRVVFSAPGLLYEAYEWSEPYETGTIYDDSDPILSDLLLEGGVLLDAETLSGPAYPEGVIDVEMSNVVPPVGFFGVGTLVTLNLSVPEDFGSFETILIGVEADAISNGDTPIETIWGQAFELNVVPEPTSGMLVLVALTGMLAGRNRRRLGRGSRVL